MAVALSDPKAAKLNRVVALSAMAVLAGLTVLLILRYAVATPMLDDWEMVRLVVKAHEGSLTVPDLFEQQQEARTVIPKLIFIVLSYGKFWDGRAVMMLSVATCCLTAFGIYRLLGRSTVSLNAGAIAFVLAGLLIFSPAQHEIWLLASGFPSFLPSLCIVWGIYFATGDFSISRKFWLCGALAVCASFTLSNGLLAWGLTFPLVFIAPTIERPRWRWLVFWCATAGACAAVYFWHFRSDGDLPAFAPYKTPVEYAQYIAAFSGSALGRSGNGHPVAISSAIGSVLLLFYLATVAAFIRFSNYRPRFLPWLALGAYSIGSASLASLGRIEWGVTQALESRYVAFSIYLAVALVALTAIGYTDLSKKITSKLPRLLLFAMAVFLVLGCFTLELMCGLDSIRWFPLRSAAARLGQSAMLLGPALDTSRTIVNVNYPRPPFARQNAEALDRLHLLRTALVRTREIAKLRHTDAGGAAGWCDGLTSGNDGQATVWGWASLPARKRPADAVVLAYANESGEWIAFALSDAVMSRPDVAQLLGADQLWSGWRVVFSERDVPRGAEISAWGLDAKEARLYRLKTQQRFFVPDSGRAGSGYATGGGP